MNPIIVIAAASTATMARVLALIGLTILVGWFMAYGATRNGFIESVYVSAIAALESVPVITFFPVVLMVFVYRIGGPVGTELATDVLVLTAIAWNIWIAQYQALKTIPNDLLEVSRNYEFGFWKTMRRLIVPYSMPKIAANLFPSFADALFYITVSEVFTVGTKTYSTFGIGSLIAELIASGNWSLVWYAMASLAIWVVALTFFFRWFARYSVSKYGLDTAMQVRRRGRTSLRRTYQAWGSLVGPMKRLSRHFSTLARVPAIPIAERRAGWRILKRTTKYVVIGIGAFLMFVISLEIGEFIISVPGTYWLFLLGYTPLILYNLAFDYLRVFIITVISLLIAVFVGYALAVRQRVAAFVLPVVQVLSAFPAPVYFPLVFIATYRYVVHIPFGTELYVLFLGFISTFYYVFYSFWIGVQAVPNEFWEIMRNYELGYFKKLRSIVLPGTLPYLVAGLSSTIDSAWGGLMIGEYWPNIYDGKGLIVRYGLMKMLDLYTYSGNIGLAGWSSLIFAIIVVIFSISFTKALMDLARKKYVIEEGVYGV